MAPTACRKPNSGGCSDDGNLAVDVHPLLCLLRWIQAGTCKPQLIANNPSRALHRLDNPKSRPFAADSDKALDELERGLGDFPPAMVDDQGVSAIAHLGELGRAGIMLLLFEGGMRDGVRHRIVLLAAD